MDMSFWNDADSGRRAGLAIGVLMILAAMAGAMWWAMSKPYAVLFSDLEAADAGRVVAELDKVKRDYRLADGGTSIMVPENEVHETRLKLMSSGMPLAGGVGFEIFDDAGFGMTEFAQRINYQRALEGELTRTIMALDEVKYARVHVVMPEGGLFEDEKDAPSASVTLFLKGRGQPGRGQIRGVQNLVASAVPRLDPAQVTVTDENGVTLSPQGMTGSSGGAMSGQLETKMQIEKYFASKVNDMLIQAFGPNQAMVSVDVTLDFTESTTTTESVVPPGEAAPGGGILRRRESRISSAGERASDAANTTTEVEYQLGRSVSQLTEFPGRIVRLGVGVVVPAGTSQERRAAVRDLVAVTVGLDESRGDAIAVYSLAAPQTAAQPVSPPVIEPVPAAPTRAGVGPTFGDPRLIYAGAGVLVLLAVIGLLLAGRGRRPAAAAAPAQLAGPDREEVLAQVRTWLEEPSSGAEAGPGRS
jgi:flagellar M-ring protein FliF